MTSLLFGKSLTVAAKANMAATEFASNAKTMQEKFLSHIKSCCLNAVQRKIMTAAELYGLRQVSYDLNKAVCEIIDKENAKDYPVTLTEGDIWIPKNAPLNETEFQMVADTVNSFLSKEFLKFEYDNRVYTIKW